MPTATLVSENPKVWVCDDLISQNFLEHVDQAFESPDRHVVEKHNGRVIVARNLDFEKNELWDELFHSISELLHLEAHVVGHQRFMVTEVFGRGQDAHVDHANLDDVAKAEDLGFLDLTKQSPSRSNPRRVVPTISIILYFNSVGGIRFPGADLTIAGRRGRMIFFENYEDQQRPMHNMASTHYGIYFEDKPKRLLVMGVLANEMPKDKTTKGLIYCAGCERDPLFHDNPSYDVYKTPAQIAARNYVDPEEQRRIQAADLKEEHRRIQAAKPDLLVSLEVTVHSSEISILGRSVGGSELGSMRCAQTKTLEFLQNEMKRIVDPNNRHNVMLCTMDGQLITRDRDKEKLFVTFPVAAETDEAVTSSCCWPSR